jgi:hypothetical protein
VHRAGMTGKPEVIPGPTRQTGRRQDYFRIADYTGVGADFVQMRPGAAYDLVRYMPEPRGWEINDEGSDAA